MRQPARMGDRSLQDLLAILVVEDDPLIQSVVEETLMEGDLRWPLCVLWNCLTAPKQNTEPW